MKFDKKSVSLLIKFVNKVVLNLKLISSTGVKFTNLRKMGIEGIKLFMLNLEIWEN